MSESGVSNVKHRMLELFSELDETEIDAIEQWICNHSFKKGSTQIIYLVITSKNSCILKLDFGFVLLQIWNALKSLKTQRKHL